MVLVSAIEPEVGFLVPGRAASDPEIPVASPDALLDTAGSEFLNRNAQGDAGFARVAGGTVDVLTTAPEALLDQPAVETVVTLLSGIDEQGAALTSGKIAAGLQRGGVEGAFHLLEPPVCQSVRDSA